MGRKEAESKGKGQIRRLERKDSLYLLHREEGWLVGMSWILLSCMSPHFYPLKDNVAE